MIRKNRAYGLKYYYLRNITHLDRTSIGLGNLFFIPLIGEKGVERYYVEEGFLNELKFMTKVMIMNPSHDRARDISLHFFIPPNDSHQKVKIISMSHGAMSIEKDKHDNLVASLHLDVIPPKKKETVTIVQSISLTPFKVRDTDWGELDEAFLRSQVHHGRLQNSTREDIIQLASKIRSDNVYETVKNCVKFIKSHVRYRANAYRLGALFALKHRKGACDEITDLCASILKALKLKVRTIIGYVIDRNFHAWLEIFTPRYGWIPVDATAGIIGCLGARWLKIYVEPKPNTKILQVKSRRKVIVKPEIYLEDEKIL